MKRVHQVSLWAMLISSAAFAEQTHFDGISAIVNDTVISSDRVVSLSRQELATAQRTAKSDAELERTANGIIKDTLERLIDRQLILDEFKTKTYVMPDSVVDELVRDRVRREFGNDRVAFTKTLREENKTFEDFKREERESIIIYQMSRKNVNDEVVVSPKKIEKYYHEHQQDFHVGERIKLRMIVLDRAKHTAAELDKLGNDLLQKARKGDEFGALADEYSDYNKSTKGGDRGWVERKDLRKELQKPAFDLKPGTVDLVKAEGAMFLIKVEDHHQEEIRSLNDARLEIENKLHDAEHKRLEDEWLGRLRKKAFVRYF